MKPTGFALLLLAVLAFVAAGCTDNSTEPLAPSDQSANVPGALEKKVVREFSGTMWQNFADPNFLIDPGVTKVLPNGKVFVKGVVQKVVCAAAFTDGGTDLFSGNAVVELNGLADPVAGVGEFWGKATITPAAPEARGGVWKLTWRGKGKLGPLVGLDPPYGWTIPLKEGGEGKGGALHGMELSMDNTISSSADFTIWTGAYSGYIKSHGRCEHGR
jgi:hypothetical protein